MSVSLDTVSAAKSSDAGGASLSWSHTCASSANGLLVALGATATNSGNRYASSVKYNGVALSSLTSIGVTDPSGTTIQSELWYLANPTTGANTVSVTFNNGVRSVGFGASLIGASSTSATGAPKTATGTSTTASVTGIPGNGTSDFVLATVATMDDGNNVSLSVTANGQTLSAWTKTGTSVPSAVGGIDTGAATGVSSGASIILSSSAAHWSFAGVAVLAPAAAAGPTGSGAFYYMRRHR